TERGRRSWLAKRVRDSLPFATAAGVLPQEPPARRRQRSRAEEVYAGLLQVLATQGYDCPPAVFDVERLKDECGVVYLTNGIDSLREIPTPASTSAFRTRSWRR